MTAATDFDSIGIATPREWIPLPIERGDFDRFCDDARRRWQQQGWDRTTERRAEILLARIRRDLQRAGVQYASMFVSTPDGSDPVDDGADTGAVADAAADTDTGADTADAGSDAGRQLLMATCVVGIYDKEELGAKVPLSLGNLAMAFGRKPKPEAGFQKITNLEPPTLHKLPLGSSVRLRRMYKLRQPGGLPERFFGESYLVPIGEGGQRCVICHFVTPNVNVSSLFSELFVQIAATLTGWTPDQETSFESEWVDPFGEQS